ATASGRRGGRITQSGTEPGSPAARTRERGHHRPVPSAEERAWMNVLVCIKRVPAAAGKMTLTPDEQAIDTRFLGFTVSPHEECAVEEAVRLIEAHGGTSAVLTLGPPESEDQLRDSMAIGIDRGIHLRTAGEEWDGRATAAAIVDAIRAQEAAAEPFDLILFGN